MSRMPTDAEIDEMSEEELLAPDLTPAELAGEPVLEDAQSSPTAGLDTESLETLVQANEDDGNQAAKV